MTFPCVIIQELLLPSLEFSQPRRQALMHRYGKLSVSESGIGLSAFLMFVLMLVTAYLMKAGLLFPCYT